jgi:hypothetical protein
MAYGQVFPYNLALFWTSHPETRVARGFTALYMRVLQAMAARSADPHAAAGMLTHPGRFLNATLLSAVRATKDARRLAWAGLGGDVGAKELENVEFFVAEARAQFPTQVGLAAALTCAPPALAGGVPALLASQACLPQQQSHPLLVILSDFTQGVSMAASNGEVVLRALGAQFPQSTIIPLALCCAASPRALTTGEYRAVLACIQQAAWLAGKPAGEQGALDAQDCPTTPLKSALTKDGVRKKNKKVFLDQVGSSVALPLPDGKGYSAFNVEVPPEGSPGHSYLTSPGFFTSPPSNSERSELSDAKVTALLSACITHCATVFAAAVSAAVDSQQASAGASGGGGGGLTNSGKPQFST